MPEIYIDIVDKIAQVREKPVIVCGNSDYTVHFTFDSEWDAYEAKTARFVRYQNGIPVHTDILFSGDSASIPAVYETHELAIGVYAGGIRTSTPARVACTPCITGGADHGDPTPDVYAQLLDYLAHTDFSGKNVFCAALYADAAPGGAVVSAEWEEI